MKNIQHRLLAILLSAACILTLILLCETPACAEDFTLAAGDYHSLALKEDGTVWAWGRNDYGQLGDGTKINRSTPVQLKISGVKALVAGGLYSLALKNDGTVWTWGDNFSGQLGDGTTTQRSTPVQVKISGVKALAAGDYHSLALKEDGTVWAWGKNTYGHLGDGTIIQRSAPVQLKISGVKALAAGDYHSLALKEDGTVWAWGKNDYGQLGDGTTTNRSAPVQVKGEGRPGFSGVKALASGADHSLALKSDGTVWAWGKNDYGQLGDGTTTNRSTPVTTSGLLKTSGLSGVTALTAGYGHSLALKEDGTVWTWGYNKYGELGDGTTTNRSTPITTSGLLKTSGLSGVTALASGDHHSLVTRGDGTVWAWGNNEYGQLGDGTTANSSTPVQVKISGATAMVLAAGTYQSLMLKEDGTVWAWGADSLAPVQVKNLSGVKALAAGYDHSLALKSDGTVWAWGWNNKYGQLGDGTTANSSTPVQVKISGVTALGAGVYHSLALKSDGTVWAWGNNEYGQLGDGTTANSSTPVQVKISGVTALAAGAYHSLALKSDGTVWAWGRNYDGPLGDGTTTKSLTPVQVKNLSGVTALAGAYHSLALKSDGTVWAWGNNEYGQLGDGTTANSFTPVQVKNLSGVTALAAGSHSLALKSDGTVWAWGKNENGQLGDGTTTNRSIPVQVKGEGRPGFSGVKALVAGFVHSLAVKSDGTVWGWGRNGSGQLGDGTTTDRSAPVQVKEGQDGIGNLTVTGAKALAAGNSHSLALKSDGTVWAWGNNVNGPLGDGTTTDRPVPVQTQGISDVKALAPGNFYSLALKSDGTVWTWGYNYSGQLVDGINNFNNYTPVWVPNLTDVKALASGGSHSLALKSDGTVWAWGGNYYGELGDGTTTKRSAPVQTQGISGVTALAAGNSHSLALKSDGTVWTWGYNYSGQLGIGTNDAAAHTTPVRVPNLSGITALAAGYDHSLALKSDGTVWAWGNNEYGQLGDGTTANSSTPVQVKNFSGVTALALALRGHHSLALKSDGTVWTWGYNYSGQLGDGTTTNSRSTPVRVLNLTGVTALTAGYGHSLALKSDGTVWAWGENVVGQLGDGTTTNRLTPVQTQGF